jgi:hypothetical protein
MSTTPNQDQLKWLKEVCGGYAEQIENPFSPWLGGYQTVYTSTHCQGEYKFDSPEGLIEWYSKTLCSGIAARQIAKGELLKQYRNLSDNTPHSHAPIKPASPAQLPSDHSHVITPMGATGAELDQLASLIGLSRRRGETCEQFRARAARKRTRSHPICTSKEGAIQELRDSLTSAVCLHLSDGRVSQDRIKSIIHGVVKQWEVRYPHMLAEPKVQLNQDELDVDLQVEVKPSITEIPVDAFIETNSGEKSMSRRIVDIQFVDADKGLDAKESVVLVIKDVATDKSDQATILEAVANGDVLMALADHNKKRAQIMDKDILNRTGKKVMLQPIELSDLDIRVI